MHTEIVENSAANGTDNGIHIIIGMYIAYTLYNNPDVLSKNSNTSCIEA